MREECRGELARIERAKVVHPLPYADPGDGCRELATHGDGDATASSPVELRQHETSHPERLGEDASLCQRVLPGRCIDDQQRLVRGIRDLARDDASYLAQLLHEVRTSV